jgi:glyoxylate utilization-related uncharacterized protein
MNLSFLPGDLHLSKNADGNFVLKMADREILNTKSERSALAKFHSMAAWIIDRPATGLRNRGQNSGFIIERREQRKIERLKKTTILPS